MNDIRISDMMAMQKALYEQHKDDWKPREPQYANNFTLYMVEELGETISIVKKKGTDSIMSDEAVRRHFCEEMSDVLMYFTEILLCYGISPSELSDAYIEKFQRNMGRNYTAEYRDKYED